MAWKKILGSVALGVCAAGCGKSDEQELPGAKQAPDEWRSIGYDDANSRNNRGETQLSPRNVGRLAPKWLLLDVTVGVTSTPAVVDGIVYFAEWGGTIRAVQAADGKELWRTPVGGEPHATPLVTADRVFATTSNRVVALERSTGKPSWETVVDQHPTISMDSSPVWAEGRIVVGVASYEIGISKTDYTFRGSVVALDAGSGKELWRVYTSENDATSGAGVSVWSSAAVDVKRKRVFIGTGNTYEEPASPLSDAILAIDYETGALVWKTQFTTGDVFTVPKLGPGPDADIGSSPNLFSAGGRDLVGAGSKAGHYKALDRDDGSVVWERTLGNGSPLGGIMTTSAVAEPYVFVCSNNGGGSLTSALRIADGTTAWEKQLPAPTFGALTVANGVLYQPTTRDVAYALEAESGATLWQADLASDLGGGLSVVDGTLYVPRGFDFLTTRFTDAGGLVAFSLDGALTLDFDGGASIDAGSDGGGVSVAQCLTRVPATLATDCKDCACNCDAAAAAGCIQSCWDLMPCVVNSCANEDFATSAGRACVEQACTDVKLLPQEVQDAALAAARCMVTCRDRC